ncbi:MAG: tetratricopeptide repeat protein, partial [Candidatus Eremiobacteraeota bacterium]|nr:tetratricopeptide repeat protein [Candidatus Eremiobacteraeota bacterium]
MDVPRPPLTKNSTAFGTAVRMLRKSRDLTQRGLADLVVCSELTIRKIEAGTRRPSAQMAALLADRLGVPQVERAQFLALARRRASAETGTPVEHARVSSSGTETNEALIRSNLPSPLGRLIGREKETREISALVTERGARLVSLTGPPGIGKTRLAIQSGWDLVARFPDGAWFVALDAIGGSDDVAGEIARTIGAPARSGVSEMERVTGWLRERRALLLLDNFEHVLNAAPLVAELLVSCPGVAAIVTSREALHVRGERTFAVPPLELPELTPASTPTKLAANPAVMLFTEAATSVAPDFVLSEHSARAVAQICVAVDGLPLALELLAGHMNTISAPALAAQLNGSRQHSALALLDRGPVDLPKRQRVLRNAIADSFGMLDGIHQTTFVRLGIFPGEFSLQAALDVVTEQGDSPSRVAERLGTLVEKNLLKRAQHDAVAPRYVMLRAIREFAREQLSDEQRYAASERHAHHYLTLATSVAPTAALEQAALHQLEMEHHNVSAALDWALAYDDMGVAARLAAALWPFWWRRGHLDEGRRYVDRVLERQSPLDTALRAELLLGAGTLARSQSWYDDAQRLLLRSLALWRTLGDRAGIARTLKEVGTVADCRGDFAEARAFLTESIELFEQLGDERGVATAVGNLGIVEQEQGHLDA